MTSTIIKIISIAAIIAAIPFRAAADTDTYVDIYDSKDPKNVVIEITVNRCTTIFKIPKNKWDKIPDNEPALKEMAHKSYQRASSGCR